MPKGETGKEMQGSSMKVTDFNRERQNFPTGRKTYLSFFSKVFSFIADKKTGNTLLPDAFIGSSVGLYIKII